MTSHNYQLCKYGFGLLLSENEVLIFMNGVRHNIPKTDRILSQGESFHNLLLRVAALHLSSQPWGEDSTRFLALPRRTPVQPVSNFPQSSECVSRYYRLTTAKPPHGVLINVVQRPVARFYGGSSVEARRLVPKSEFSMVLCASSQMARRAASDSLGQRLINSCKSAGKRMESAVCVPVPVTTPSGGVSQSTGI
jgi:hypothetical protein